MDFRAIALPHGVRKGTIFYSDTFKSWVLQGHPEIDLIYIDAPYKIGDVGVHLKGKAARFNGCTVEHVGIDNNRWRITFRLPETNR